MSEHVCPCCGHDLPELPEKAFKHVALRPLERRVVDVLARIYPRGLTERQLAERVYASDPNGGPEWAEKCMAVHLHYARKKLAPIGWRVGAVGGRHGTISLQRIDA